MIFISYSIKDQKQAQSICKNLEDNSIECWMAPRNIRLGDDFAEQIGQAIRDCDALVFIASKNSDQSQAVHNEIKLAYDMKKMVVPFLIDDSPINDFSKSILYYIGNIQWIDAYSSDIKHASKHLVQEIKERFPDFYKTNSGNKETAISDTFFKNYSGKIFRRKELETHMGLDRFRHNGRNIVRKITMVCYTSASVINTRHVTTDMREKAYGLANYIDDSLRNDDEFEFSLVITNPASKAAAESIYNRKLGNPTFNNKNISSFDSACDALCEKLNHDDDWNKCFNEGRFLCKVTDVSLPYALMKVEYVQPYENFNHIKVDLYSPFLSSNSLRRTIIVSTKYQPDDYYFFDNQIASIAETARDFSICKLVSKEVTVHRCKEIEKALDTKYRQYLTGKVQFTDNMDNYISYVETGISRYDSFRVDQPHYHRTTAEHYYILEGAQKIVDINKQSEIEVKQGDFVFIPAGTKHVTKNKPGTRIFFVKAPEGKDKILLGKNDADFFNFIEWKEKYDSMFHRDDEK